MSPKFQKRSA